MAFGTFDRLHPGHVDYLRQAREYGGKLVVVVARDRTVVQVKGKRAKEKEDVRLKNIKNLEFVDLAVLGQLRDRFAVVREFRPNVICLGYDQVVDMAGLREVFKGQIVRLKPFKEDLYKSSKM
jgi:FAD synthetase